MEYKKNKHGNHQLTIKDDQGDNKIIILSDCSQIQIENENGDVYIDINKSELEGIRDMINLALKN